VEIVFHSHHATISDRMQLRAKRGVDRIAQRLTRVINAIIRFEQDGPVRRVEIVLQAPRQKDLIAEGTSKFFGPALGAALARLETQARKHVRPSRNRARRLVRV
jgi:ribosome-associated translation inhibitor RaiA